jgi:hypothetical protein
MDIIYCIFFLTSLSQTVVIIWGYRLGMEELLLGKKETTQVIGTYKSTK